MPIHKMTDHTTGAVKYEVRVQLALGNGKYMNRCKRFTCRAVARRQETEWRAEAEKLKQDVETQVKPPAFIGWGYRCNP